MALLFRQFISMFIALLAALGLGGGLKSTPADIPAPTPAVTQPATTATPPATTQPSGALSEAAFAEEIFRLTNLERAAAGLPALARAPESLWEAARVRAQETVGLFSHTRPDGRSFSSVFGDFGVSYLAAGENLQWSTKNSPQLAVSQWMGSASHRANILNAQYKELAVAVYGNHCVQLFRASP